MLRPHSLLFFDDAARSRPCVRKQVFVLAEPTFIYKKMYIKYEGLRKLRRLILQLIVFHHLP